MKKENMKYGYILLLIACGLLMATGCAKDTLSGSGSGDGTQSLPEGSVRIMLANGNIDGGGAAAAGNGGAGNGAAAAANGGGVAAVNGGGVAAVNGGGANAAAATNSVRPRSRASAPPVNDNEGSENYVEKIQVFFYGEGKLECVRQYEEGVAGDQIVWDGASDLIVNRVSDLDKAKDIYVVTNWMDDLPVDIIPGSTIELLKEKLTALTAEGLPFTPSRATPILMSGAVEGYVFHEPGQAAAKAATISLHRQMVKVEVKVLLDSKFYNTVSSDHTFGHAKLSVYNMPSQSFVLEKNPAALPSGAAMLDPFNIEVTNNANTWNYIFYSYENPQTGTLPGDKIQSIYFNLNVPYTKTVDGVAETHDSYYRVYIDDTGSPTSPHKTLRNNHYTVTVTLVGFGIEEPTFDAIHAVTTVTQWNSEDIEQEVPGKDMTINKTEITGLTHTTVDRSILIRSAKPLDPDLTPTTEGVTYPTDMPLDAKNILITFDKQGDNAFQMSVSQNMASYKGTGKTTFYVVYGRFKKKITVGYHPVYTLATGHLIVSNGILQISNDPANLGSIFRYGSVVATVSDPSTLAPGGEGGGMNPGVITPQSIQWEPLNKTYPAITGSWKTCWAKVPYWAGSGMPPQTVDNIRRGLGDPCRLVGLTKAQIDGGQVDNGVWKTPSYEEAEAIVATPGARYGNGWKLTLSGSVFMPNYDRHIDGTCNAWLFDPSVAVTGGPNNSAHTSFWILYFPGHNDRVPAPIVLSYTKEYGYPIRCIRQ